MPEWKNIEIWARQEWGVISGAPFAFIVAVAGAAMVIWGLLKWVNMTQIANLNSEVRTKDSHIAFLTDQLNRGNVTAEETGGHTPMYGLWAAIHDFTLWQIAHLWVDQEPIAKVLPGDKAYPILQRLKQDAKVYRLMITSLSERGQIDAWARVSRAALRSYANEIGERPRFLFPEDDKEGLRKTGNGAER